MGEKGKTGGLKWVGWVRESYLREDENNEGTR